MPPHIKLTVELAGTDPASAAMQDIIEQGYSLFRRYPVPSRFNVCCAYCFSEEQQQALRQTSIRTVPFDLLRDWNSSCNPEAQDSNEIRYLLPRLLEFIAYREFPSTIDETCCLRRVGETNINHWRPEEQEFMVRFAQQFMRDWVSVDDVVELDYMLQMFHFGSLKIAPLLDAILDVPGYWVTVSLAYLLYFQRDDMIRDAFVERDEDDESVTHQIKAWATCVRRQLFKRAAQAIETPESLRQCSATYSAPVDSWMIDECLCAMHDASLQPGKGYAWKN